MSALCLTLREPPARRVDLSPLTADHLAGKTPAQVAALPLRSGNRTVRVDQLFSVSGTSITEIEIRNWQVETKQGPCTFQTKLDDWPHPLGDGTFVLRDVAGNLFLIPDPATLDARSRKLLWPFVG